MTDTTAFEGLIAEDVRDEVGPEETIDALAIARQAKADSTRWRLSMFSALKFVTASVIVALFGGLLLAGVLTTQQDGEVAPAAVTESPSPTTTEELLSGLITEQVEPGVFRVIGDGVRDLSVPLSDQGASLITGRDGSVWLLSRDGAIRLGRAGALPDAPFIRPFQVGPDGTVWLIAKAADVDGADGLGPLSVVVSFDGEAWTVHPAPADERLRKDTDNVSLHVASDGTVLVSWPLKEGGTLVTRLGADGWQPLPGTGPEGDLVTTDDGVIWVDGTAFYRDGQWQGNPSYEAAAVSRDGTHWFVATQPVQLERNLGDGPTTCPTDGAPERFHPLSGLSATTDGSLWVIDTTDVMHSTEPSYRLARFDCAEWDYPLEGETTSHVAQARIADDGSVWVLTSEDPYGQAPVSEMPPLDLYVITPEAVVASE